jgi:hypothetical protein
VGGGCSGTSEKVSTRWPETDEHVSITCTRRREFYACGGHIAQSHTTRVVRRPCTTDSSEVNRKNITVCEIEDSRQLQSGCSPNPNTNSCGPLMFPSHLVRKCHIAQHDLNIRSTCLSSLDHGQSQIAIDHRSFSLMKAITAGMESNFHHTWNARYDRKHCHRSLLSCKFVSAPKHFSSQLRLPSSRQGSNIRRTPLHSALGLF